MDETVSGEIHMFWQLASRLAGRAVDVRLLLMPEPLTGAHDLHWVTHWPRKHRFVWLFFLS